MKKTFFCKQGYSDIFANWVDLHYCIINSTVTCLSREGFHSAEDLPQILCAAKNWPCPGNLHKNSRVTTFCVYNQKNSCNLPSCRKLSVCDSCQHKRNQCKSCFLFFRNVKILFFAIWCHFQFTRTHATAQPDVYQLGLPDVWYFTGLAGILLQIWQWPIFLKSVPAA